MVKFQKNLIFSHFCLITNVLLTDLVIHHSVQTLGRFHEQADIDPLNLKVIISKNGFRYASTYERTW